MNCTEATKLLNRRAGELSLAELAGHVFPDVSDLGTHLSACTKCREEFERLRQVRRQLASVATDRPSDLEVENMWAAVATQVDNQVVAEDQVADITGWWTRNRSTAVALVGVAAVLMIALQLGNLRYVKNAARLAVNSNAKGIGASAKHFQAHDSSLLSASLNDSSDDPSGWGTPVHATRRAKKEPAPEYTTGLSPTSQTPPPATPALPPAAAPAKSAQGKVKIKYDDTNPAFLLDTGDELESLVAYDLEQIEPSRQNDTAAKDSEAKREPPEPRPGERPAALAQNLKIIKTGELAIEVPAYATAVEKLEEIVDKMGAFIADATTREEAGGALVGRIVIRVSPERFEELFSALKAIGRVDSENVKAADVTAEFVDTEARIRTLQVTEERLRELITNKSFVDKIASLLEVERELNRVRTQIEQLQGQLRVMADRIAFSTITLTLREPGRTVPSASLSVEVLVLDVAAQAMSELLAKTGGRLVSGKTSKRNDGTLMGTYQLETSLAHFAEVVSGIESLGRVQERQVADQQFGNADESWAQHVRCGIALVLFERTRQLPSGGVRLEVGDLEQAMPRLMDMLAQFEASVASNQASHSTAGSTSAELRIRVPAGRFAALVDSLSELGRVISKSISGESGAIQGGAAAVPCDLVVSLAEESQQVPHGAMTIEVSTFETARQSLSRAIGEHNAQVGSSASNQRSDGTWQGTFRLLVPAGQMESFVRKLEALGRVSSRQISGLGLGDLSRIDPDALGSLDVSLAEKSTLTPAPEETAGSIRARIRDGLGGFYQSIGLIAYGLTVMLPWLVLAAVLALIAARVRAGIRKRQAAQ